MSKLLLPLLSLCLAAWLFGGAIWFGNQYSKSACDTSWELTDGNNSFHAPTTFTFQDSEAEVILDDNQSQMLSEIAAYLNEHQDRHLNLTGYYTKAEINNSDFANLGKARAESFLYLLYRQGVTLEQLHTSGQQIEAHPLNGSGLIRGGVDFYFVESPFIKYGIGFTLRKEIHFEKDSPSKIITKDFDNYIAAVRQYLIDHPDKKIQLTGFTSAIDKKAVAQKRVFMLEKILTQSGIQGEKFKSDLAPANEDFEEAQNYVALKIM